MNTIIIGTRGSELALWQSEWVKSALLAANASLRVEMKVIRTTGEMFLDSELTKIGGKGLFTKEIEDQLLDGSVDLAVHSLKDLPTTLVDGLRIGAVTARSDPADVLVSKDGLTLEQLPPGATVLTGSLRRRAQLLRRRPDLLVAGIRGNIRTRLRKLDESEAQGLIMAAAALERLNLRGRIAQRLEPIAFLPACGQGALGLEIRSNDSRIADLIAPLNDPDCRIATNAERCALAELEGGCHTPFGAYASITDNRLSLYAMLCDPEGKNQLTARAVGAPDQHEQIAHRIVCDLIAKGGREILDKLQTPDVRDEPNG